MSDTSNASETFRAGVGALILNSSTEALALERYDPRGAWQLPQGGIKLNESLEAALWRELHEETGLTQENLQLFKPSPEWLGYELPSHYRSSKTGRGQVHKWFILFASTDDLPVNLKIEHPPEFVSWQWLTMSALIRGAVQFRRPVYERLGEWLKAVR